MRKATLDLLRCPACQAGSLIPDQPVADAVIFGPVRCIGCGSRFPVHEGLIDFVSNRGKPSPLQQAMELPWVARSWERYVRPAVDLVLTRGKLDRESEYVVVRNMLGKPQGPLVDLGCGTGIFLRRFAADFPNVNVIGLDVSRPMVDEAIAQLKESALAADFVRAEAPPLPFLDHSIGAVAAVGLVHFVTDLELLLRDIVRVLRPQGRFVASTWDGHAQGVLGLHPRSEETLREMAARVGLIRFERMKVDPFLVWSAELP